MRRAIVIGDRVRTHTPDEPDWDNRIGVVFEYAGLISPNGLWVRLENGIPMMFDSHELKVELPPSRDPDQSVWDFLDGVPESCNEKDRERIRTMLQNHHELLNAARYMCTTLEHRGRGLASDVPGAERALRVVLDRIG